MISEVRLVDDAYGRLCLYPELSVGREVPLLGRYVDLVYVTKDHVVTVEFKLHDWRRAVRQARDHLLGADYSLVCVPSRRISAPMKDAIAEAGLGLAFFETEGPWPFRELIPAPRSQETWDVARSHILQFLGEKGHQQITARS